MSEENEQSSEVKDQKLETEALEATDSQTSPAEESEAQGVPVAKHVAVRKRAQSAELEVANLRGQLTVFQQAQEKAAPAAKSPLDLEIERQAADGIAEEDMVITPSLYRKQKAYDERVADQMTAAQAKQRLGVIQLTSAKKARTVHDDFDEVVAAGERLLTEGQLLDVSGAGADFGEIAYAKCSAALKRSKTESESKTNTAPEKKPSKLEAEEEKEKVPTQKEILAGLTIDPMVARAAQL